MLVSSYSILSDSTCPLFHCCSNHVHNVQTSLIMHSLPLQDPGSYPSFTGPLIRRPDYCIGRSMYEFSKIPQEWVAPANSVAIVDEIWVASSLLLFAS